MGLSSNCAFKRIDSNIDLNPTDFRQVSAIFEQHQKAPDVKVELLPSSHSAILSMVDEGFALKFTGFGVRTSPPSCQSCLGCGSSQIGDNEVGLYTTNRNYRGRHGSHSSQVYLAGPLVAAATAVTGYITDPRDF